MSRRSLLFVAFFLIGATASCDCSEEPSTGTSDLEDVGGDVALDAIDHQDTAPGDATNEDTSGDGDALSPPTDANSDADTGSFEEDNCGLYQAECEGSCIPVSNDPVNCGGCAIECGGTEVCSGGQCVDENECPGNLSACDGSCTDTFYDNDHCGICGNACDDGEGCVQNNCVPVVELGDAPDFCEGSGPVFEFDDEAPASQACAGDLAESTFRWGICSCESMSTNNPVTVDGYDSSIGPYTPGGPGGGIGTNGAFVGGDAVSVSGTLWSTAGEVFTDDIFTIGQRLYSGANLDNDADVFVGGNAYIIGDIILHGNQMDVGGTLFISPDSNYPAGDITAQDVQEEDLNIGRACTSCEPDERIDVAGIVANYAGTNNDNDLIGLESNILSGSGGVRLELPCGAYYLDEIDVGGPTTIVATGNTALFIGGDVTADSELTISLTADAQFDVFVAGKMDMNNPFRLGSPNYPGLMRLYIGGGTGVEDDFGFQTNNEIQIGGYIYAVPGGINTNNEIEIYGGLYGRNFISNNEVDIHYDRRVATVGKGCPDETPDDDPNDTPDAGVDDDAGTGPDAGTDPDPDPVCQSTDGACGTDSDCCSPLTCENGTCALLSCQPAYETCNDGAECCSGICSASGGQDGICIVN